MEGAALVCGEIVAPVVGNEVDYGAIGQSCRLIEPDTTVLDMGAERTHRATIRAVPWASKRRGTREVGIGGESAERRCLYALLGIQ